MKRDIAVVAYNIRSTYNVGALLRLCDGLAINKVIFSGYTPYPKARNDKRLPHIVNKLSASIYKTSLGAENSVNWHNQPDLKLCLSQLKLEDYCLIALEQSKKAINLSDFKPTDKIAIILGNEVEGLNNDVLKLVDKIVQIPMLGSKESHNVVQASAMALYHCRFAVE